jgi:membrane protease YdiL (CAAX protease family)
MIYRQKFHPLSALLLTIFLLFVFYLLLLFAVKVFLLLYALSPIFLVLAAILDSSVFLRWWAKTSLRYKIGILNGVLYSLVQLLLLPFVSLRLLVEAYLLYKMRQGFGQSSNKEDKQEEYIDYEEIQ